MRVHVFSDLHLEFGPLALSPAVRSGQLAELVLLAGDIHTKRRGVHWAAEMFSQPVAMVFGNHEAYGDDLQSAFIDERSNAAGAASERAHDIRALENEAWSLTSESGSPVRIIAATLWTDFAFFGA